MVESVPPIAGTKTHRAIKVGSVYFSSGVLIRRFSSSPWLVALTTPLKGNGRQHLQVLMLCTGTTPVIKSSALYIVC